MTGPVEGERFSAYVEHVQDQPYEKTDVVTATKHEVMQTVKDLMALNPLYREAASVLYNQVSRHRNRSRTDGMKTRIWGRFLKEPSLLYGSDRSNGVLNGLPVSFDRRCPLVIAKGIQKFGREYVLFPRVLADTSLFPLHNVAVWFQHCRWALKARLPGL
jgi:hypothetical protein